MSLYITYIVWNRGYAKREGKRGEYIRDLFTDAREYYIIDIYYAIRYHYKTTNHLIYIIIILCWHYGQDIDKTYFKKGDVEVSKIITQYNVLLFSKRAENEYSYSYGLCKHCFVFETSLHSQRWFWLENKITENQWKIAETSTSPFKKVIFDLFRLCPATFGILFSQKNSWNQLKNWKKPILALYREIRFVAALLVNVFL